MGFGYKNLFIYGGRRILVSDHTAEDLDDRQLLYTTLISLAIEHAPANVEIE